MEKADNPSAFPYCLQELDAQGMPRTEASISRGMGLRDYFAGMALQSCYAQCTNYFEKVDSWPTDWREGIAEDCYKIADAMLIERTKQSGGGV